MFTDYSTNIPSGKPRAPFRVAFFMIVGLPILEVALSIGTIRYLVQLFILIRSWRTTKYYSSPSVAPWIAKNVLSGQYLENIIFAYIYVSPYWRVSNHNIMMSVMSNPFSLSRVIALEFLKLMMNLCMISQAGNYSEESKGHLPLWLEVVCGWSA